MKALSAGGTAAMFLVGGGILVHGLPWLRGLIRGFACRTEDIPGVGTVLAGATPALLNGIVGVLTGALVLATVTLARKLQRIQRTCSLSSRFSGCRHARA